MSQEPIPDIPPAVVKEAVDHKSTESRPVEPVIVSMIGTGDGGHLPTGTIATTPGEHQPNVIVRVVTPIAALGIRFANAYVTTLVGLLTVGVTTDALPAADFAHLVVKCASLSLAGPGVALGKDLITILGRLERKYPLLTGNV